jgi:D-3-phosphoglycerate dehydrogenase
VVFNTPGTNANAVAEMIVALTLALARKVCQANAAVQSGQCPSCAPAWLQGVELRGKTLGLLGTGAIACRAAAIFQSGFGMQVVAWSPSFTPQRARALGMQCAPSMDEVLAQADVLSLGMSLNDETRGILGAPQLAKMKKSAFLINTARGALVDEAALYHALANGALAGAASDVFVHEPPAPSNPLLQLPNFIATPHIAANTEEALLCTGQCVVQGLLDVLQGRTPPHCLT